jgi:predicted nucleic acid-binding protein
MSEAILDANVLVAQFDEHDALAARADGLMKALASAGHTAVILDFLLAEAISVAARRARERKATPPDLAAIIGTARRWVRGGHVRFVAYSSESRFAAALDVIEETGGTLNFNDALLVVLQREGSVEDIATFDERLAAVPGFKRIG